LAKFFITANIPIKACQNKYLRAHSGDAVGKYALQQTILPKLKNELHEKIEAKLNAASYVTLVTDTANVPYLGLGVATVDENFKRETFILGIQKMQLPQNAENVAVAIKAIIDKYELNKAKNTAVVCDEGKNLMLLFKEADGAYYLDGELVDFDFDARNDENDYDDKDEDDEKEETIEDLVSLEIQQFDSEIRKNTNTRHIALDDKSEYDFDFDFNGNMRYELIKDLNLIIGSN
jgi:hypothetical protein